MLRAVLDTNIFVTALLYGATPRRVYEAFLNGRLIPVFSSETLAELIDVLSRSTLRVLISQSEASELITLIQRDGILVRPRRRLQVCRDFKDNVLLECALAGRVRYLVTGDKDLLTLHPFRGVKILKPSDFLPLIP